MSAAAGFLGFCGRSQFEKMVASRLAECCIMSEPNALETF